MGPIPVLAGSGIWWIDVWYSFNIESNNTIRVNYFRDGSTPFTYYFGDSQPLVGTNVNLIATVTLNNVISTAVRFAASDAVLTRLY